MKCKGPKAFLVRSVWRRKKQPYVYLFTNKTNYIDFCENQNYKFITNSNQKNTYFSFYATTGKHLEETNIYMQNIVNFIESHSNLKFDELAGDFVKSIDN